MEEILKGFMDHFDKKMNHFDKKLDYLSKDVTDVKDGLSRIETRIDSLEIRMDSLETRMDNLETKVEDMASEFRSHFVKIESELEQHRDLNDVKSGLMFLSSKVGIHDTKINMIEERLRV